MGDDESDGVMRLPIPRGPAYLAGWSCLVFFGFLAVVTTMSEGTWLVRGLFLVLAVLGLGLVLALREDRVLEADADGIRILRGSATLRNLPWPSVKEVRYGTRPMPLAGFRTREGVFLSVFGPSRWRRIAVNTEELGVLDAELARFAARVARYASSRGVAVRPRLSDRGDA